MMSNDVSDLTKDLESDSALSSALDLDHSSDLADKFWDLIEQRMACAVPKYLQNILRIRGFENATSIKTLTANDFEQLQEFVRKNLKKYVPEGANPKEYYHIFSAEPESFEIIPGHLRMLQEVVQFVKDMTETQGPAFFHSNPKIRKPEISKHVRRSQGRRLQIIPEKLPQLSSSELHTTTIQATSNNTESSPVKILAQNQSPQEQTSEYTLNLALEELTLDPDTLPPKQGADNFATEASKGLHPELDEELSRLSEKIKLWTEKNLRGLYEQYSERFNSQLVEITEDGQFDFLCFICKEQIKLQETIYNLADGTESSHISISNVERHLKNSHVKSKAGAKRSAKSSKKKSQKQSGNSKTKITKASVKLKRQRETIDETSNSGEEALAKELEDNYKNECDDEVIEDIEDSSPVLRTKPKLRKYV